MPHIPRWAAPQEPQGPDSIADVERDDPPTANTDNNFSTLGLSHFLQATLVVEEGTIFSKVAPHSWHLYSKSGIRSSHGSGSAKRGGGFMAPVGRPKPPLCQTAPSGSIQNIANRLRICNQPPANLAGRLHVGSTAGAFFVAFSDATSLKSLDSSMLIVYIEAVVHGMVSF